jgi:hypothetical protein
MAAFTTMTASQDISLSLIETDGRFGLFCWYLLLLRAVASCL